MVAVQRVEDWGDCGLIGNAVGFELISNTVQIVHRVHRDPGRHDSRRVIGAGIPRL